MQSPIENKAAVEIIKGPAAIRYGFTAPGGIVNYVLKRPTARPYTFVQTHGDSNGSIGIQGDFGGTINEKFGYRINVLIAEKATFVDDVAGPQQFLSTFFLSVTLKTFASTLSESTNLEIWNNRRPSD